ncbi:MAG: NAD(P)-dependent oxidoreductase [Spirochaetes bacterium]|nr:NAD(P)-dependent oxidoreductase [Spirochaetota bacterium]
MAKQHILVTGGAGYLGGILVPVLLQAGYRVTVLDNLMWRQSIHLDLCALPDFDFVRGDCRDEALLTRLLKDVDFVFPLAALVGAPLCDKDQVGAVTTNRDAIASLVKIASRQTRLVIPITNSGYGIGEKGKECTEDSPLRPISLYGRTKVEAEKIALDRGNAISLRLATVFGAAPRMRLDLLVNEFVWRALADRCIVIFEGHFKRNYIHIRDVARAFLHALGHFDAMNGQPYNVGLSDTNISKLELCERIKPHVPGFVWFESKVGEDPDKRDYVVSNAKIEKTGFQPAVSLDDGIRELLKAYRILRLNEHRNA